MGPDQLLMLGIDLADILVMRFMMNIDGGDTLLDHVDETREQPLRASRARGSLRAGRPADIS
jgi:hypothetical protein